MSPVAVTTARGADALVRFPDVAGSLPCETPAGARAWDRRRRPARGERAPRGLLGAQLGPPRRSRRPRRRSRRWGAATVGAPPRAAGAGATARSAPTAWYGDAGCAGRSAGAPARLLRQPVSGLRPGALYEVQVGGQGDRLRRFTYRGPSVPLPHRPSPRPCVRDPSGQTMPVGNLPGWRQAFADDFRTAVPLGRFPAAVAQRWWAYPTSYHDTSNHGTYDPGRTTRVSGGLLRIHLHTAGGRARVSAPRPAHPRHGEPPQRRRPGGLRYGRYSIRFRARPGARLQDRLAALARLGTPVRRRRDRLSGGKPDGTIRAYTAPRRREQERRAGRVPLRRAYRTGTPRPSNGPPGLVRFFLDAPCSGPRRRACRARPCTGCCRPRRG